MNYGESSCVWQYVYNTLTATLCSVFVLSIPTTINAIHTFNILRKHTSGVCELCFLPTFNVSHTLSYFLTWSVVMLSVQFNMSYPLIYVVCVASRKSRFLVTLF